MKISKKIFIILLVMAVIFSILQLLPVKESQSQKPDNCEYKDYPLAVRYCEMVDDTSLTYEEYIKYLAEEEQDE